MGQCPARHLVDVHILLLQQDRVLLSRRRDPDRRFHARWHLPAGKLEDGESVLHAAAREAYEEVGVHIETPWLRLVHTVHARAPGMEPRLGLFYATERWSGMAHNREPEKCLELEWFPVQQPPEPMIDYPAAGLLGYCRGTATTLLGW